MITNKDFNAQKTMATYLEGVPYDVTRHELYSAEELYRGYSADNDDTFATCYDTLTYDHFVKTGKHGSEVLESLARALHDHGINVALDEFFKMRDNRLCIGIMGGHAVLRTDEMFRKVVFLCKRLTEEGFIMLSGGGPGAMEATHLGPGWLAVLLKRWMMPCPCCCRHLPSATKGGCPQPLLCVASIRNSRM